MHSREGGDQVMKYLLGLIAAVAITFGVVGLVKAQSATPTQAPTTTVAPTSAVQPTSVPAGAPATGYGTMAR